MSAQTWTVTECDTTWLPDFPLGVIPSALDSQVRVITRGKNVGLEVGGVIGSVPLLNGDTLHITPKVGPSNYFRMLLSVEGLYERTARDFDNFAAYEIDPDVVGLPLLLARRFLSELAVVKATGLRFGRSVVRRFRESPAGKLRVTSTHKRLRQRSTTPFVCDLSERDYDIPENRVLAAAAWRAAGLVSEHGQLEAWQSSLVFQCRKAFHRPESMQDDLAMTARGLAEGQYGGPRGRYVSTLTLARLILGQAGISQGDRAETYGDAMLVNSATLFEEYVRAVISRGYKSAGLTISKGGEPVQFLYDDGTYGLVPDIRISRGLKTLTLGDAKYKEPDAGDHYQMSAYMRAYGVRHGFLLCPDFGDVSNPVSYKRSPDGRTIVEFRLPLRDLNSTEAILANLHMQMPFLSV